MSTTVGGIRIVDMPDLGVVTDDSSVVGEHAGSGRFTVQALRNYVGGGGGTYSIKDFGAKSDGVTDDCNAVTAAIAAILALPHGGKLIIPAGRTVVGCPLAASIPAGVTLTIEGMGPGASELYFQADTGGLAFRLLNSGSVWGSVSLHGFTLTRGPTSPAMSSTGINVYADPTANKACNVNMSFRDLVIQGSVNGTNTWMYSLILSGIGGTSTDNVSIFGLNSIATDRGDALMTITGPNTNQYAANNNIVNCTMAGGSVGLLINGFVQGVAVANTTIIGQYDSIRWIGGQSAGLFAEELAISNCSLNGGHRGVYTSLVNSSSITGTTILHFTSGVAAGFAGIELNQAGWCSVVGNNVIGATTGIETGILLSDGGGGYNTVIGNLTTNITGYGIWLAGTVSHTTVVGNSLNGGAAGIYRDTANHTIIGNCYNSTQLDFSQNSAGTDPTITTNSALVVAGNIDAVDGINMQGGIPGQNVIIWNGTGVGNPTFTTRSVGTKLTLYPSLSSTQADYAVGFGSNSMWFSIAQASNIDQFQWFAGTTPILSLDGTGALSIVPPVNAANDAAAAGAGVPVGRMYRNGSILMVRVA